MTLRSAFERCSSPVILSSPSSSRTHLTDDVRLIRLEDQSRLPTRQIQHHLREITIRPSEPRSSIIASIVDVDTLVDESETVGVVEYGVETGHDLVIVVAAEDSGDLGHWPGVGRVHVGTAAVIVCQDAFDRGRLGRRTRYRQMFRPLRSTGSRGRTSLTLSSDTGNHSGPRTRGREGKRATGRHPDQSNRGEVVWATHRDIRIIHYILTSKPVDLIREDTVGSDPMIVHRLPDTRRVLFRL